MNIVWFKRDLRVQDHGPLFQAARSQKTLALYIFEPERIAQPDYGANHHHFILDCLAELEVALEALNIPLLYMVGEVTAVFEAIHQQYDCFALHSHIEVGVNWTYTRDKKVKRWCRKSGLRWQEYPIYEVMRPNTGRDDWAKRWKEGVTQLRYPEPDRQKRRPPIPEISKRVLKPPTAMELGLGERAPHIQRGGRKAGIALWHSFIAGRGENYRREMSSPLTAFESCSRLSPHLAWGTISIREIYCVAQHAQTNMNLGKGYVRSIESLISRLHWRGHFMQKLEDEVAIEHLCMHAGFEGLRPKCAEASLLEAWKDGRTGVPFVDACMRALCATGWLNFRMRAMVVSFACYNLWLDWREIRDWLACQFTDYEPGIHICQLQMQSGVTGINTIRMYNPYKQSTELDPDGVFIKRWVPELETVPKAYVHQPEAAPPLLRMLFSEEALQYPEPIVDVAESARTAKKEIFAVKQSAESKQIARAVFQKHGSRRRR